MFNIVFKNYHVAVHSFSTRMQRQFSTTKKNMQHVMTVNKSFFVSRNNFEGLLVLFAVVSFD